MSKTDHPRKDNGGHSVLTRTDRRFMDDRNYRTWRDVYEGIKRPVILAVTEPNDAVMAEPKPACKSCGTTLHKEPLAEWEKALLGCQFETYDGHECTLEYDLHGHVGQHEWLDYVDPCDEFCDYACLEDWTVFHDDLGGEYRTDGDQLKSAEQYHAFLVRRGEFVDADVSEVAYGVNDHWIPYAATMEEVRDIFGGGDFTVVHTFRTSTNTKPAGKW